MAQCKKRITLDGLRCASGSSGGVPGTVYLIQPILALKGRSSGLVKLL